MGTWEGGFQLCPWRGVTAVVEKMPGLSVWHQVRAWAQQVHEDQLPNHTQQWGNCERDPKWALDVVKFGIFFLESMLFLNLFSLKSDFIFLSIYWLKKVHVHFGWMNILDTFYSPSLCILWSWTDVMGGVMRWYFWCENIQEWNGFHSSMTRSPLLPYAHTGQLCAFWDCKASRDEPARVPSLWGIFYLQSSLIIFLWTFLESSIHLITLRAASYKRGGGKKEWKRGLHTQGACLCIFIFPKRDCFAACWFPYRGPRELQPWLSLLDHALDGRMELGAGIPWARFGALCEFSQPARFSAFISSICATLEKQTNWKFCR